MKFPGLSTSTYSANYIIGNPLTISQGYSFLGVNMQNGIYQFRDMNNDGQLNKQDYTYIGTTNPDYYGGLQNIISYKKWQLGFLLQFIKQKGLDPVYSNTAIPGTIGNQPIEVLSRWQNSGNISPYQLLTQGNSIIIAEAYRVATSSASLTNSSFIRLKNLSLSWELTTRLIQDLKIKNLKFILRGQNLITITSYKGLDPEIQSGNILPPTKMFTAGVQIIF